MPTRLLSLWLVSRKRRHGMGSGGSTSSPCERRRSAPGSARRRAPSLSTSPNNWLNLTRLGLIVFEGNERAVGIYERLGFAHEGTMRRFGFGDGACMDAHMMGRIRPSPPPA